MTNILVYITLVLMLSAFPISIVNIELSIILLLSSILFMIILSKLDNNKN